MNTLEIKLLLTGLAQVKAGLADLSNTIKSQVAGAYAVLAGAAGIASVGYALGNATKTGVAFNAELEQARIGIASILRATNPGAFKSFNESFTVATAMVEKLKKQAMESPATFKELVAGFQSIVGAATAAGVPLKKQTDLIIVMSQALSALGIRSDQLVQESRAILSGEIDKNAMAARMLGITKADIEAARQQNRVYEFLMEKLQAFTEASKVGATTLTVIVSNLKDSFDQSMGEATKKLFDELKAAFLALTAAIATPEAIGAMRDFHDLLATIVAGITRAIPEAISTISSVVGVIIQEWKAGRIDELIGLTIELGFELGLNAVKIVWMQIVEVLSAPKIWNVILNACMSFGVKVAEILIDLAEFPIKGAASVLIWTFDNLRVQVNAVIEYMRGAFAKLVNLVAGMLESTVNPVLEFIGEAPLRFSRMVEATSKKEAGLTWAESWKVASESVDESSKELKEFLVGSVALSREYLGMTSEASRIAASSSSAWERMNALMRSYKTEQQWKAGALPKGQEIPDVPNTVRKENVIAPWLVLERKAKEDLLALDAERARVEGNFALTKVEKWSQEQVILKRESDLLTDIIAKLKEQAKLSTDPKEAEHIMNSITSMEARMTSMTTKSMTQGPNPTSMVDQLRAAMVELRNEWGTLQQSIAKGFKDVIGAAVSSVANGISGLIKGTMTWAEALRNIGSSIMNAVIDSIARMFAEWIVGRLAVKAVEVAAGQAEAAAKAPGALFTSISSYGVAGWLGVAALIAGIAAISGAFADGGRPPVGQVALVGERGPELFVPDSSGLIIPADVTRDMLSGGKQSPTIKQTFITAVDRNQLSRLLEEHIDARVIHVLNTQS